MSSYRSLVPLVLLASVIAQSNEPDLGLVERS